MEAHSQCAQRRQTVEDTRWQGVDGVAFQESYWCPQQRRRQAGIERQYGGH